VLSALSDGPIGVTEVAERTELAKSTAARLLASLAREGAVEQVPGQTRYRLGPRMATLSVGVAPVRNLVAIARPILEALARETGEAAGLSVPDGATVHYIDQVDSTHEVQVRDWTGTRVPMHAVSSGQVFLAHMNPTEVERYLAQPRVRRIRRGFELGGCPSRGRRRRDCRRRPPAWPVVSLSCPRRDDANQRARR
jgi:DNA-binding IclR family transcriptional regulator